MSHPKETLSRSLLKTISYRVVIIILDFSSVFFLTGKIQLAFGFTLVSNIYTTIAYFFHERVWDEIRWGRVVQKKKIRARGTIKTNQ